MIQTVFFETKKHSIKQHDLYLKKKNVEKYPGKFSLWYTEAVTRGVK